MSKPRTMTLAQQAIHERFPRRIRQAGLIWSMLGLILLAIGFINIFLIIDALQQRKPKTESIGGVVVEVFFGVYLAMMGSETTQGKPKRITGNAFISIATGAIFTAMGCIFLTAVVVINDNDIITLSNAGVSFLIGLMLFVAGGVSLKARDDYREWKNAELSIVNQTKQ